MKSRVVLQILKLGYNVLLSDVDVYWFKNPLPLLNSFGPSVLVAQSDEFNITGAYSNHLTLRKKKKHYFFFIIIFTKCYLSNPTFGCSLMTCS